MAKIQIASMKDFTGGLNLRSDAFQLGNNESPDMLNIDVDPRGGFNQRKGVLPFGNALLATAQTMWEYATTNGVRQAMVSTGSNVKYSTGGTWSLAFNRAGRCHATTFKDRCYIVEGTTNCVRWDGSTATPLNTAWNNDIELPWQGEVGSMPVAKCITSYLGHCWVANTLESGFEYKNRIRFSHPNYPEDWRDTDFIDVDTGVDGDEITALMQFSDRLLIFKKRSIHALFGSSPENFYIVPVSYEVGAISQEAVVGTDVGVYFFSWPDGVFLYDGNQPRWVFERLKPALDDGLIPHAYQDQVQLGWGNRRLWVSVPYSGSSTRNRVFVLDPTLGGTKSLGSWMAYDLKVGPFLEWNPPGSDALLLAATTTGYVLKLDQQVPYDNFGLGPVPIKTRFRTRWIDLGEYAVIKRFKRPEVVLRAGTEAEVFVRIFKDYDPTNQSGHFTLNTQADPVPVDPDEIDGNKWNVAQWNVGTWGGGGGGNTAPVAERNRNEIHKGSPLGTAKAVALEFYGPETLADWGVDSLTVKFIPKKVRS